MHRTALRRSAAGARHHLAESHHLAAPAAGRAIGRRVTAAASLAASSLLLVLGAPAALAEGETEGPPEQPFEITDEILQRSITVYDPARSITELGGSEQTEDEVIVLEADILFASNAWDLSGGAAARIVELAAEIPEGTTVQVGGHTDSLPVDRSKYDFDNQQLSENRAQAVADALAAERPDLTLEVTGHGDTKPSASGGGGDDAGNAADRRVELRYGD